MATPDCVDPVNEPEPVPAPERSGSGRGSDSGSGLKPAGYRHQARPAVAPATRNLGISAGVTAGLK